MPDQNKQKESSINSKILIDTIILIVTISTLIFNVYQYNTQVSHNLKEQFDRELWLQKKEVYTQICSTLGSIVASSENDSSYTTELKQFLSLYYGSTTFVYDAKVRRWLDDIRLTLATHFNYKNPDDIEVLREKLEHLSLACRNVLIDEQNTL